MVFAVKYSQWSVTTTAGANFPMAQKLPFYASASGTGNDMHLITVRLVLFIVDQLFHLALISRMRAKGYVVVRYYTETLFSVFTM